MAKVAIDGPKVASVLRNHDGGRGWVLCIGAGTSLPAFPDWWSLVDELLGLDPTVTSTKRLRKRLATRLAPDAVIQAASERTSLTNATFADKLYGPQRSRLKPSEWKICQKALAARNPGSATKKIWSDFLDIVRTNFKGLSALAIAEVVVSTLGKAWAPRSILSFNAVPLFFSLLNALTATRPFVNSTPSPVVGELHQYVDLVTHGHTYRSPDRVPMYFCHGLLQVPGTKSASSDDYLVMSEAEYLSLANKAYAWQS